MGMFDYLHCAYPLPVQGRSLDGWQTKDTPAQFCDEYEIREDGSLWHHAYDLGDAPEGSFGLNQTNQRWEPCPHTGPIRFYDFKRDDEGWVEYCAVFKDGQLKHLELLINSPA